MGKTNDIRPSVVIVELREEGDKIENDCTVMFVASNLDKALQWCKGNIKELALLEKEHGEGAAITFYLSRDLIDVDIIDGGNEFIGWITSDGKFNNDHHPRL